MTEHGFDLAETDRLLTTTRSVRRRLDLNRPVPREVIEDALEVAVQAPTANNQQQWRWLVLTDPETKSKLAELFQFSWRHHEKESWTRSGRRRNSAQAKRNHASTAALVETIGQVPALVIPCILGRPPDIGEIDEQWLAERGTGYEDTDYDGTWREGVRLGPMRASNFYGSIFPAIWSFQLALRSRGLGSSITSFHVPFEKYVGQLLGIPTGITQVCMIPVAYTIGTDFRRANRRPAKERTFWERWEA